MKRNYIVFALLIVLNLSLFLLGNIIYSDLVDVDLIIRIIVSELCFITLYSFTDYANKSFGIIFAVLFIPLLALGYLKAFNPLFYSNEVQLLSISIAIAGSLLNFSVFRTLYNRLKTALFSSRISTSVTSVIEVAVFSYFLEIGLQGFLTTIVVRFAYIYIVPKILFKNIKNIKEF